MFGALEELKLEQADGVFDGKPRYSSRYGRGRLIESFVHVPGPEGLTRAQYTILVAPPLVPTQGARIEIAGRKFRVGAVKICRDIGGRLVGCRCEVVQ